MTDLIEVQKESFWFHKYFGKSKFELLKVLLNHMWAQQL